MLPLFRTLYGTSRPYTKVEISLRSRRFDIEPGVHIQKERAVGDMTVDEGSEGVQIVCAQPLLPWLFAQDTLDYQPREEL